MIYKVLKSGGKTKLVHEDAFEGEAKDYFVGGPSDAQVVGEVNITGNLSIEIDLADIYGEQE